MIFKRVWDLFRSKKKRPRKINRGRYLLKPIMGRTLKYILAIDDQELFVLIDKKKLTINGQLVTKARLAERLESGKYIVAQDDGSTWRFFIV